MTRQKEQEDQTEKQETGKGNRTTALRFQTGGNTQPPFGVAYQERVEPTVQAQLVQEVVRALPFLHDRQEAGRLHAGQVDAVVYVQLVFKRGVHETWHVTLAWHAVVPWRTSTPCTSKRIDQENLERDLGCVALILAQDFFFFKSGLDKVRKKS